MLQQNSLLARLLVLFHTQKKKERVLQSPPDIQKADLLPNAVYL